MSELALDIAGLNRPVDFLILTALLLEREALTDLLDNVEVVTRPDETPYTYHSADLTTMDASVTYRIVIAMPLKMGQVQAALVMCDALRTWKPRFVLTVGIAGGIEDNGVRLGDVVGCSDFLDATQGIMDVDGRTVRFTAQPAGAQLYARLQAFTFAPDKSLREKCPDKKFQPQLKFGVMVSGNDVIKSKKELKKYLDTNDKVLGVEMEGAAVAAATNNSLTRPPILMIRGISDFADENKGSLKTASWRPYAAHAAAHCAVAFLKDKPVPPAPKPALVALAARRPLGGFGGVAEGLDEGAAEPRSDYAGLGDILLAEEALVVRKRSPQIAACFVMDDGEPEADPHPANKRLIVYSIEVWIENAPEGTSAVKYQLDESYYDAVRRNREAPEFKEEITSYGDYIVGAQVRSDGRKVQLYERLSIALERTHGDDARPAVRKALQDIKDN